MRDVKDAKLLQKMFAIYVSFSNLKKSVLEKPDKLGVKATSSSKYL